MNFFKVIILLSIIVLQLNSKLYAQNQNAIDSLQKIINKKDISAKDKIDSYNLLAGSFAIDDSVNIFLYTNKSIQLAKTNKYDQGRIDANSIIGQFYIGKKEFDKAEEIYNQNLQEAKQKKYGKQEASANYNLAQMYAAKRDIENALEKYKQALKKYQEIDKKLEVSRCESEMALIYLNQGNYDEALVLFQKAIKVMEKLGNNEEIARNNINTGVLYRKKGDYEKALFYYEKALEKAKKANNDKLVAGIYNNLGTAQQERGFYPQALTYFQESLKIKEKLGDKKSLAIAYTNIGALHDKQQSYDLALQYYEKASKIFEEIDSKQYLSYTYINIGGSYKIKQNYDSTAFYYQKALDIVEKLEDKSGIASVYQGFSELNLTQKKYEEAIRYIKLSLQLREEINEKSELPVSYIKLGAIYYELKEYKQAEVYLSKGVILAKEYETPEFLKEGAGMLADIYSIQGNYKKAYENQRIFQQMKDSLSNTENTKMVTRMESEYKFKQVEDSLQQTNILQQQQIDKDKIAGRFQRNINILISIILFIVVISTYFIYRSRNKGKRLNIQLNEQKDVLRLRGQELAEVNNELQGLNEELHQNQEEIIAQRDSIEQQNQRLEEQHYNIKSSIRAAHTIQDAILPFSERMKSELNEHFLIYRPRDVVSGDFYWLGNQNGKKIIGALDCTGHGIPGAFMSLIGVTLLNEIINTKKITEPAQILEELRYEVRYALRQQGTGNSHGMDAIFVTLEDTEDADYKKITIAGAKRPCWYIEAGSNEIKEIKGSKISIGVSYKDERKISSESFLLKKESLLYFGSDGIIDQNDKNGNKFGTTLLKKFFEENYLLSLDEQKEKLDSELDKYMEATKQRDDMLWIGIKI